MADKKTRRGRGGDELVLLALGGLGEIGMNCYLYGLGPADGRQWLMVDIGITFPEGENDPGVDVIMPDLRFIEAEKANLAGLVLTHAHEDHFGALIELWPKLGCPVYATPFTAALIRAKLAEYGGPGRRMQIIEVPVGGRFTVGPFDLEMITMEHSIPEPNGLAIRTALGRVLHTGDWKLDPNPLRGESTDEARIKAFAAEGVDVLVCDSTNALRAGRSPSEQDVTAELARIIKAAEKRVAITIFASNVARIRAIGQATRAAGRELVVAGRAMHRMIQVARDTGHLPTGFAYHDQNKFRHFAPDKVVVLCTGSQGEERAALARVAEGEHPEIKLTKGDTVVFSSRNIPGNERTVGRLQNLLVLQGVKLITDGDALVHVTGHPRREELKDMYAWVHPRAAVPMHGEARHLMAHAELARAAGVSNVVVATNGQIVRLMPGPAEIVDDAPVGRLFRDGRLLIGADEEPVRERRKLAVVGIIVVSLVLSARGEVIGEPDCVLDGIPIDDAKGYPMEDIVLDAVEETLKRTPPKRRGDLDALAELLRRAVRGDIDAAWGKKPVVKVMITQVPGKA